MLDIEEDVSWLTMLAELNAVIAETHTPLVGNLCYDHFQVDFPTSPPNPILRAKRDRFRSALRGRSRLLEVGVNGGHSAFLALSSNRDLQVLGVDICEHAYAKPAGDWLASRFPGRFVLLEGDCRRVLPQLIRAESRFDVFHIDGAKFTYADDIRNCQLMIDGEAVIIVDDTQLAEVSDVVGALLRKGRLEPLPQFPSMEPSTKYRNEIVLLHTATRWQRVASPAYPVAHLLHERVAIRHLKSKVPRRVRRGLRRAASMARHPSS